MGVITNRAETSFFDQGEKKLTKNETTYRTSNDIIEENGRERLMIEIKFSENIFLRTT